ncbi:MAG: DUF4252 domain-containing protein [Prevotella sp.]|jgi:hypothetical protein|nr:DUF4252 domain-containing protein [Prevotella sp.]
MKKIMFSFVLAMAAIQFSYAQDLNSLINELAKTEGAQHQVIDRSMLNMANDQGETDKSALMQNLDSIVVLAIEGCKPEIKDKFLAVFENFKDGNGYETLLNVKDGQDKVLIVSHKEGDVSTDVYILALDEKDIAIVKMSGKLSDSDLADIIDKQKNK